MADIFDLAVERTVKRISYANTLDEQDPTQARRASTLGQELGVDEGTVAADLDGFEKQRNAASTRTLFDYAPGLAAFAADPNNAAKVKDDLPPLSEISRQLGTAEQNQDPLGQEYVKSLRGRLKSGSILSVFGGQPTEGLASYIDRRRKNPQDFAYLAPARKIGVTEGLISTQQHSIASFARGTEGFLADMVGLGDQYRSSDYYAKLSKNIEAYSERSEAPIEGKSYLGEQAYRASQSLSLLGTAVLTGRPYMAFGLGTGGEAYGRFRERGASANEALLGAGVTGGAEVLFERIGGLTGLSGVIDRFGKEGTKSFLTGALKAQAKEVGSELATTAVQNYVDAVITGGVGTDEYLKNLPRDLLDTAVSTAMMTGALTGGVAAWNRLRPAQKDQEDIGIALAGSQFLDGIMTNAEASKLRKEDPATFRDFVDRHAENTPVRNIYVPAEAVATFMQSEGYDGSLDRFSDQIAEAQATQGDVVIPIADAAAYLAGTPAWEALNEEARITPGGFSQREAREKGEELFQSLEAEGKALAEQAETQGIEKEAIAEVKDDIKNAILATGRVSSSNADAVAEIAAHRYAVRGAAKGQTPMQAWKEAKVSFLGAGETGQMQGRQLAQPLMIGDVNYAITDAGGYKVSLQFEDRNEDLGDLSIGGLRERLGDEMTARVLAGEGVEDGDTRTIGNVDLTEREGGGLGVRQLFQGPVAGEDLANHIPGYGQIAPYLDDEEKANLREASILKMVELVETFPGAEEMASVAFAGRAKKGWYERSAQAILDVFGMEDAPRFAALLAATSPQNSVESNTINALNIWMNWDAAGRPTDPKTIKKIMGQSVQGGKGEASVLDAWVNNTYRALTADNPADIKLSGPKVNSFMLNLVGVVDEVTNDAWMANWALVDQQIFRSAYRLENGEKIGQKGIGYKAMNALVRRAADILTQRTGDLWTPSNVQEAVWSFTKVVSEAREAAGSKTVDELLQAGGITHADIAETPDFALLFQRGIYRRILEEGGYGEAAEQLAIDTGATDGSSGAEGSVASPEGAGIDPAVFLAHLGETGRRIEERVAKSRKKANAAQLSLFETYDTTPLEGLPQNVKVDGLVRRFGPHAPMRESARRYMLRNGLPYNPPTEYVSVNPERATAIAAAFEAMPHNPEDPEVKRAYRAMIDETVAQYKQLIRDTGLVVEFIEGDDPYGNPRNAILDVVENNHLWVFPTDAGFGGPASAEVDVTGNPLLEVVPGVKISGRPVRANDLFRVVHDVFGHIKEGVGFRADGEENAWRVHSAMYSPLARRAMTTETRGQNSWVNYGPFGEANRTASGADTEYAPQKIGLLPLWISEEGSGQPQQAYQDVLPEAGWTPERLSGLIDRHGRDDGSADAVAVMMTPDEYLGALASEKGRKLIEERVDQLVEYGPLDIEKLRAAGPPVVTIAMTPGGDRSGPMVRGHDGRHRATMLKKAGVGRFPVVVQLMDKEGKQIFVNEPQDISDVLPNRSRSSQLETGDTPLNITGAVPISWKNYDALRGMSGGGRVLFQSQDDVFYSALEQAVRNSHQAKATGAQWLATLRKTPGIKAEELEWTGLVELLESTEGPVTRDQLVELLENGGIQLDEVMLAPNQGRGRLTIENTGTVEDMPWTAISYEGETLAHFETQEEAEAYAATVSPTQFQSWSSDPSNPTYRELLLTLPVGLRGNPKRAPSTHWEVEGVVAHTRFMDKVDADGKKVLFIEEVQSDWHQKGRDQGYATPPDPAEIERLRGELRAAQKEMHEADAAIEAEFRRMVENRRLKAPEEYRDILDTMAEDLSKDFDAPQLWKRQRARREALNVMLTQFPSSERDELLEAHKALIQRADQAGLKVSERDQAVVNALTPGIPNAPFKASWPTLVMKRIIRYAAENGYDRVAWTTGKEQAERYDLAHQVDSLDIRRGGQGAEDIYLVRSVNDNVAIALRQQYNSTFASGGYVRLTEGQVIEAFGKELGGRMIEQANTLPLDGETFAELGAGDLQVGGEGMKAFYDRNLVNITNDIIKKMGAKVGGVHVISNEKERQAFHEFDALVADAEEQLATARRIGDPETEIRAWEEAVEARKEMRDAARRNEEQGTHPGFDITDQMREKVLKGQPLFQQERGSVTLMDNGEKIIKLFANSDSSTLIHELSHVWLEELRADALAPGASKQAKTDWATLKAWWAEQGHVVKDKGAIPTPAHELFARGGERYVMEGRAPSTALGRAFSLFRAWMTRLYQVVENLNSPITPEIREVFGRLLATQEEIDAQARMQSATPLFRTAEDAGMTPEEFAAYQENISDARDEAYNALLFKTMEAIRKRVTAERRQQRSSVRDDVAAEIGRQPMFVALHLLRTGRWLGEPDRPTEQVKLNTGWLIDSFGEDILDKLPRGLPITRGDGQDGDVVAEMVGMASGTELVNALVGMRAASDQLRAKGEKRGLRDKMIEEEVDRIMAERHGDTLNDGSIEEEAIAALNTAAQGDIISAEIRQLTKRTSIPGRVTPYQMVREWAKRKVSAGKVNDVASRAAMQRYTRATAKAARAAEEAILGGNIDEAYKQKQAQLINHALLAESKAAADRVDTIVSKMRRLSKRAAMKSVDPDYMAKVHMLLEDYDFRPRSQRSIDEQEGFEKWMLDQRSKGYEIHIPPRLENNGTPYSRVSVEELEAFNDVIDSLLHVGKVKQKLKTAQGERDFAEWRDEALAHMQQLPNRKLPEKPINEEERILASASSELLKIETIAEELDGGKTGPFNDLITVGSEEAENRRVRLREKVTKPLIKLYLDLGRAHWKRLQEKVTIPELMWNTLNEGDPRIGQPVTITRMELLTIALNTGNLSNLEKMSKGERWPVPTIQMVLDRELNKEDWDLVQSLWSQVETLWPDIVLTEREMSGVTPEKVVNSPIDTKYGTYQGGYWPVVYDAARWQRAEDIEGQKLDDMFGLKSGVATQKGHTIERTAAHGPISFNLEGILFNHIEQVVTRVAYAPFARDVLRAIRDKQVRGLMDTKLGPEYRKQIEPWLQRQINEGASMSQGARWWNKVLRQFRINMTIAAMGFRFSTGVAQTLGLTASAQRIGARWVGTGFKTMALNPRKAVQFVWDRSEEMLYRTENFSREMNELSQKMRDKHGWFTQAQYWAMWHIGMIDRYCVSVPTWLGAHAKGVEQGMTDEEASRYADKEVRMSQGSGREKDLSKVQSMANGEAFRFFTMFYTPFNVLFNAQWQGLRGLRKGDVRPAISVTFWWMMASMLGDAMLSGDWPEDTDEDGGIDWASWFARNVFFGMFAGIPLARDLATGIERKMIGEYTDPGSTPVTRVYDAVDRSWTIGDKYAEEGELPEKPLKTFGNLAAVFTGLPLSQPATTGQFLWDYSEGESNPDTVSDWYFGITKDKVPSDEGE